jgi:uncharacterized membrane protein (GlpM family)
MNNTKKYYLMGAAILAPALIVMTSYKFAKRQFDFDKKTILYGSLAAIGGAVIAVKILKDC